MAEQKTKIFAVVQKILTDLRANRRNVRLGPNFTTLKAICIAFVCQKPLVISANVI
jgi:hypothetical protein